MAAITTSGGGRSWQRIVNPGTSILAAKTSGWTADSFSGGLEVDFSSAVPGGTVAVIVNAYLRTSDGASWYYRPSGDTNISNTPEASLEYSCRLTYTENASGRNEISRFQHVFFLSSDYKIQITPSRITDARAYIAYPMAVLL